MMTVREVEQQPGEVVKMEGVPHLSLNSPRPSAESPRQWQCHSVALHRWRIFTKVIPIVAVVGGVRLAMLYFGHGGWATAFAITPIITANIFVSGMP